jgi:hypothetical protein
MALHLNLPIYKTAYDLAGVMLDGVRYMRRDIKKVLGEKLLDQCTALPLHIRDANIARDKGPHIDRLLDRLEWIEFNLRLARDQRFISTKLYSKASQLTQSIGRQASGWKKHSAAAPAA